MILLIVLLILVIIILRTLQVAYFSPLSSFPNAHFLAPLTSLWLFWIKATKRELKLRDALHEKLGPVVRLGPRELSINDAKGVKVVYGGGFEKDDFFQAFVNYGENVMFSTMDSKSHTERKRMLSHVYSKSYIQNSPELSQILETITTSIKTEISAYAKDNKALDIYKLTKSYGMDVTTAYLFGLGYGTNFVKQAREGDPLDIFEVGLSPSVLFWNTDASKLRKFLEKIGWKPIDSKVDTAWSTVQELCFNLCSKSQSTFQEKTESPIDEEKGGITPYPKTVYAHLYHKLNESYSGNIPKEKLDKKAAAEMLDHMLAGNEGIGITLTYLTLQLSTHPEILHRLQSELKSLSETDSSPQIIDTLPLLDAILQETMRLYPAANGPFPRIVPDKGAEINGVKVSRGTKISSTAYSLHRNGDVFTEPEFWRPDRWLVGEGERRELGRWWWAFGSGGRMCIGNHLAIRMMKAFVVAVYGEFESMSVEERIPKQVTTMMGIPEVNRVFVKFRKVE